MRWMTFVLFVLSAVLGAALVLSAAMYNRSAAWAAPEEPTRMPAVLTEAP